jgi:endoglucanase
MKYSFPRFPVRVVLLWAVTTVAGMGCVDTSKPPVFDSGGIVPTNDASIVDYPDPATGTDIDGGMRVITSMELVREMGIGWNLGNTLDATGGETAWGNPLTTQEMIQAIANSGFRSMRIPVTWRQHFGPAPDYTIDTAWMDRVQEIVGWALDAGLYVIINMHHDGGTDTTLPDGGTDRTVTAWLRKAATDYDGVITQYRALWAQIATRFRDDDDHLVFESMNEVGFDSMNVNGRPSQAAFNLLNQMNAEFVMVVRGSGGNNRYRHLLLAGYNTDIDQSIGGVVMFDSRCILSLHYYTPYQFCINGTQTTWGSQAEIDTLGRQFAKIKTNFIDQGVPVILGEYGAVLRTEAASRTYWTEWVAKVSIDYGIAPFVWDNGSGGEFNRRTLTWRTPGFIEALQRAASGAAYVPTKG